MGNHIKNVRGANLKICKIYPRREQLTLRPLMMVADRNAISSSSSWASSLLVRLLGDVGRLSMWWIMSRKCDVGISVIREGASSIHNKSNTRGVIVKENFWCHLPLQIFWFVWRGGLVCTLHVGIVWHVLSSLMEREHVPLESFPFT